MSDADGGALHDTYRDLSEIDRRPEGIRYAATLSDGTPVVALALADDVCDRVRDGERFIAAFARAGAVRHEALSPPLLWGDAGGTLHCAYGHMPIHDLEPGALSPADVAMIGVHVARALGVVHDAGLVHGSIATAAITRSAERGTQLARFGLFNALCEGGLGVRDAALLLSDPAFVSPEMQMGKTPDERSDIFSLGASLYELLTGKPPYGGRTTSFVMASVLSEQVGADDDSNDAIAGPVIDALLRAIEHAPDDRWRSADAFAQALAVGAPARSTTKEPERQNWVSAIFRSWFPARRSRRE